MTSAVVLAAAAYTATHATSDQNGRGIRAIDISINMTAVPGTDTVTPHIQGKAADGTYYDILVGTAISTISETILRVGENITSVANLAANAQIPDIWRINFVHSAATSFTYNACANMKNEF